ncbi:hypothetical protein CCL11_22610 [Pseudomonas syringae]|uniref:hypothetical protein n=1 Tax=Pseudomonas syringae TaxID=317 RepID=UPI000BB5FCCA|nr:hypothetical protein [Pseudomonas syringae]PBP37889.1 hypothetical protein CCL11_22610 [Pseudomonas syringae]
MHYLILRRRHLGIAIDRKELHRIEPVRGDIQIAEYKIESLGRIAISAFLYKSSPHLPDVIPPLIDVTITSMATNGMNLTGIEQVGDAFYWQSWWCRGIADDPA